MACQLCGKERLLTSHHLVPRSVENDVDEAIYVDEIDQRKPLTRTVFICKKCHVFLHQWFTNQVLATKYNTLEKLLEWYKLEGKDLMVQAGKNLPKVSDKTKYNKKFLRLFAPHKLENQKPIEVPIESTISPQPKHYTPAVSLECFIEQKKKKVISE
jgi:hypothetical protein